ncbi:MAG: hypothetical protein ACO3AV_08470 [Ilumatobacteraceae bacterium]
MHRRPTALTVPATGATDGCPHSFPARTITRIRHRAARLHAGLLWREESGQATTEYALVMLGAALVALLVVAWATSGGAGGKIGRLFDKVVDTVIDKL